MYLVALLAGAVYSSAGAAVSAAASARTPHPADSSPAHKVLLLGTRAADHSSYHQPVAQRSPLCGFGAALAATSLYVHAPCDAHQADELDVWIPDTTHRLSMTAQSTITPTQR